MIVVVGHLAVRTEPVVAPAGRACEIALAAVRRGASVELVGRVGEDAAGEALLLALARAGVGHAAVLRDPARPTLVLGTISDDDPAEDASPFADPAPRASVSPTPDGGPRLEGPDVDLAVRYLEPSGALVVTDDAGADALAASMRAALYAGLSLIVLLAPGASASGTVPDGLPEDATVLVAPDDDDPAFAGLVGAYAAALESGLDPAAAFAGAAGADGWEASPAD